MKHTLLQIADELVRSHASLAGLGYSEEEIEDNLLLVEEDLELKLAAYGEIIETCEMRARHERVIQDNAANAAERAEETKARLEAHIMAYMRTVGASTADVGRYTYRLAPKKGKSVVIVKKDPENLPDGYKVFKDPGPGEWRADKNAIYAALVAGEEIEGCELEPRPLVLEREVTQ